MVFHNVSNTAHTPRDDKREAISDGLYFIETVYTLLETHNQKSYRFFPIYMSLISFFPSLSLSLSILFKLTVFDGHFVFISF